MAPGLWVATAPPPTSLSPCWAPHSAPGSWPRIDADLDDLLLPWIVDLSCLRSISQPALLDHIARVGQVLYRRNPG